MKHTQTPEAAGRRRAAPVRAGYYGVDDDSFRVNFTPSSSGIFSIYLFGAIESPNQFIDAIHAMDSAGEGDLVEVHLSTDGGSLDATDTFLASMNSCDGRVVVLASGGVHSAGSVILLQAKEFVLSENFNMLIHNGGYGAAGKYSDVKAQTAFTEAYMETLMRTTYDGFLTDEEIEQLIGGKDFWMEKHEFMERWNNRAKYFAESSTEGVDTDTD